MIWGVRKGVTIMICGYASAKRLRTPALYNTLSHFKGDWYFQLDDLLSYSEAEARCIKMGGQLAIVYDENTHDAIYQMTGDLYLT